MKLLFLIGSMTPESGGPAIEVARLTELLLSQGNRQVTVASPTPRQSSVALHTDVDYVEFNDPVFPLPSWFQAIGQLRQLINQHDILFVTGIWGPIDGFALRLAASSHKPIYIRVCGTLEPYILARNPHKKWLAKSLYMQRNLKQAQGIIVNSKSEARNVQKVGISPDKILVIPNGVRLVNMLSNNEEARRKLNIRTDYPVLLYLGRIHPKKGLHILLQAMALLPEHKRKFTLLVAGEFSDQKYEMQVAETILMGGLQEMVRFVGMVAGEQKEQCYQAASGFVLPSKSEGQPNAVLEAMARGLPVIITKGCNIPEVAEYQAGLVVELSVANLTSALNWFVTGGSQLSTASTNALRLVRDRYSHDQLIHKYNQLIYANAHNTTYELL